MRSAGLGLRRALIDALIEAPAGAFDFLECAPDNWIGVGGALGDKFAALSSRHPLSCHGLSLSLGGPDPLDMDFLRRTRDFLERHQVALYSEHLSYCSADGHLYDLLPIPFTGEAVRWVAERIRRAQDILEMKIGIENASYYVAPPGAEMSETEFISAIIAEADCLLHLDVNNIYVNSRNFGFDPLAFMTALPLERTCYIHVAGHYTEPDGLLVDTHGAEVIDPVWALLDAAYRRTGPVPTCLERDFNIPDLATLTAEVEAIGRLLAPYAKTGKVAA